MQDTYIYNALSKEVVFKALGNHFTMKPGQIKRFNSDIGDFIAKEKGYLGLVALDERFDDPEFKASDEGKALLEERRIDGVNRRVAHLKMIADNLLISLKQDLEIKNMKVDPLALASPGEQSAMEELVSMQRQGKDDEKKKLEQMRALERQLKANSTAAANSKKD